MRLSISSFLFMLIQLFYLKSSTASNINTEGAQKIGELYNDKMQTPENDFVEKCKNLSEQVLKDSKIQEAATPFLKEFKQNITDYLDIYPIYKHYYATNDLLTYISEMIIHYATYEQSDDNEFQYIVDLLREHGFDEINLKYDEDFELFMNETIIPEFETFASELQRKERDLRYKFLLWLQDAKECYDYECYLKSYTDLCDMFSTPKDELFQLIYEKYDKINIKYAAKIYESFKFIINDNDLTKVQANLNENFTKDCNDYIGKYESNTDPANLVFLLEIFNNITVKYFKDTQNIVKEDQQLLSDLFVKHKLQKLLIKYHEEFKNFIKIYLSEIFDNYKSSLDENDLENNDSLFKWYDKIKQLKTHEERLNEFHKVYDLEDE